MTTPIEKKLTIQIRVEPGCLGPDGKEHIETFCAAAAKIFAAVEPELVSWVSYKTGSTRCWPSWWSATSKPCKPPIFDKGFSAENLFSCSKSKRLNFYSIH
ncbi:TPA: hypothetical protein ACSP1H_001176 [Aeromonas veronii]|uniref:hypothetical protein n=1 Tax=Aeromonas veronii TaxID=654 RepID=UPI0038F420C7